MRPPPPTHKNKQCNYCLKQSNLQTRDKFEDPITLLFGRHKCMVPMECALKIRNTNEK